jgi:hypothetical protein
MIHGILDEMELTALVGNAPKAGFDGGAQARMVVADNVAYRMKASGLKGFQKFAPVHFGFAERTAGSQNVAPAGLVDANGHEHRAIPQAAIDADLFEAGIQNEVGESSQRPIAPGLELGVEILDGATDLGAGNLKAAKAGEDFVDLAGGDALDIHLGHGKQQRLIGAAIAFEGGGIKFDVAADLRDVEVESAEGGVEGSRFEAVGVAFARGSALVGEGFKGSGALHKHGFVQEGLKDFREGAGAFLGKELEEVLKEGILSLRVGHGGARVGWVEVFFAFQT